MNRSAYAAEFQRVPAPALVLAGVTSVQLGAAIAKSLFDQLTPTGVVALRLVFGTLVKTFIPPLNEIRAAEGLPAATGDDFMVRAPLVLYMTAEPFEYPRSDWPESIHMIGPGTWDPPADPPEWLATIDRPIVLVTTSSEFQVRAVNARNESATSSTVMPGLKF